MHFRESPEPTTLKIREGEKVFRTGRLFNCSFSPTVKPARKARQCFLPEL
jgi:hypothetical protein